MNASNPFQIPSCLQVNFEHRRRERFRKGVIAIIAATATLIVGLLIEGCVSEGKRTSSITPLAPEASVPQPEKISALAPAKPVVSTPAQVSQSSAAVGHPQTESVYVVKSGDTLTRIAKSHAITVRALKSANDLSIDHIVVGAKLKITTA